MDQLTSSIIIFASEINRYCCPGYEDVRDLDGQWIRIEIKKGDLIVLPPGMYHRFTLDHNNYLKVTNYLMINPPPPPPPPPPPGHHLPIHIFIYDDG
jgi:1,2-dihydroxy-3-keto-5-methylthiopentene dioxygenase